VSRTAAAEFARVKAAFPGLVHPAGAARQGCGFTARRRLLRGGSQSLYGRMRGELEHVLWLAESSDERR